MPVTDDASNLTGPVKHAHHHAHHLVLRTCPYLTPNDLSSAAAPGSLIITCDMQPPNIPKDRVTRVCTEYVLAQPFRLLRYKHRHLTAWM